VKLAPSAREPRKCVMKYQKKKLVRVLVSKLKPHPRQATLFAPSSEEEIQALAASMEKDGQIDPIEITPDNVIICGHQRVEAAKLLGWKELLAWVRDDLAEAGAQAVEKRLIKDNLLRRQLTNLDYARAYLGLRELEYDNWVAQARAKEDYRDHVGHRFGVEGRTLDRWASILRSPMSVQQAYTDKILIESDAIKIAQKLDAKTQTKVAKKIEAARKDGGARKEVKKRIAGIVANYFARNGKPPESFTIWSRLKKALQTAIRDFDCRASEIKFGIARPDRDLLHSAIALLRDLRQTGKRNEEEIEAAKRVHRESQGKSPS